MSSKIKVYKGNPTAGGTDGTLVSTDTWLEPIESGDIEVPESGYAEGSWIKCAVRCDETFETRLKDSRHVRLTIETVGGTDHTDKWQLAPDDGGSAGTPVAWGAELDLLDQVIDENTLFHVRARAHFEEGPANDQSCQVKAAALIGAQ